MEERGGGLRRAGPGGRGDRLPDRRGRTGEEPAGRRSPRGLAQRSRQQAQVLAGDPRLVLRNQPRLWGVSAAAALTGRRGRRRPAGTGPPQAGGPVGAASASRPPSGFPSVRGAAGGGRRSRGGGGGGRQGGVVGRESAGVAGGGGE